MTNARALNPPKTSAANSKCDKERHPNLRIAQPRHEQVEGRTRPLLVNGVKKGLLHANKDQPDLSFTR